MSDFFLRITILEACESSKKGGVVKMCLKLVAAGYEGAHCSI